MINKLYNFITKHFTYKAPVIDTSTYGLLLTKIDHLSSAYFKGFNSTQNNSKEICSQHNTIYEYNGFLHHLIVSMNSGHLYNGDIILQERIIPIVDFFLTNDKKYLDEEIYVEEFKNLIHQYFTIINDEDTTTKKIRNRKLSNYTNSLLNTFNDLVRFENT